MANTEREARVRRRVAALGPRGRTTRIPRALRAEIVNVARERRAAGASWRAIGAALGVSEESVRRWTLGAGRRRRLAAELIPVHVPAGVDPGQVVAEAGRPLMLWSPTGYRVEGLSVAETAELLRRLA